jgi:hypothetical protein
MSSLGASISRPDGRELLLHVGGDGDEWIALALETARGGTARAEGFARRWLRGKKIDECGCEEIVGEAS